MHTSRTPRLHYTHTKPHNSAWFCLLASIVLITNTLPLLCGARIIKYKLCMPAQRMRLPVAGRLPLSLSNAPHACVKAVQDDRFIM